MPVAAHLPLINSQPDRLSPPTRTAAAVEFLARTLELWRSRIRERDALSTIDERARRDFGLSPWETDHELARPFRRS